MGVRAWGAAGAGGLKGMGVGVWSGGMEGGGMWPHSGKEPRGGVTACCAGYVTWDP